MTSQLGLGGELVKLGQILRKKMIFLLEIKLAIIIILNFDFYDLSVLNKKKCSALHAS